MTRGQGTEVRWVMDCDRVSKKLRAEEPLDAEEHAHATECSTCAALLDVAPELDVAAAPSLDVDALLERVERTLKRETGWRARIRAWPTRWRAGILLGTIALLLGSIGVFARREFDPIYPNTRLALLVGGFCALSALLVLRTLRGPERAERPWLWLAVAFFAATVLEPLLPQAPSVHSVTDEMFVAEALKCFAYGVVNGAPVALLVALFDRRDRMHPRRLWLAGAAGATVGLAALALHCRFSEPAHLAAGHTTAAFALTGVAALALFMAGRKRAQN